MNGMLGQKKKKIGLFIIVIIIFFPRLNRLNLLGTIILKNFTVFFKFFFFIADGV